MCSVGASFVTFFSGQVLYADFSPGAREAASVTMLLANVVFALFSLVLFLQAVLVKVRNRNKPPPVADELDSEVPSCCKLLICVTVILSSIQNHDVICMVVALIGVLAYSHTYLVIWCQVDIY
jgi:hypothetical protein